MLTPGAASVDALPPEVDNDYLQESVAETRSSTQRACGTAYAQRYYSSLQRLRS